VAYAIAVAREAAEGTVLLVNLSGRGDKDVQSVAERRGEGRR
jgi:tryptophan synthase beta subunit